MYITQEKYLNSANKNLQEWFIDNNYDIIFIPLVARDYLTAYLLNFINLEYSSPDLDYVLDKLSMYDKNTVKYYSDLNIKFSEEIKDINYYLPLLLELKKFVNAKLEDLNRNDFKWIEEFSTFTIKDRLYNFKKDYPQNMPKEHIQLFDALNDGFMKLYKQKENIK